MAVRILHSLADAAHQEHAVAQRATVLAPVIGQGKAVRVLHHEPRRTVFEHVGVVDAGDAGMIALRERQLFHAEALPPHGREPSVAQQLDGNLAADVGALGKVNNAHAALAEQPQQSIRPDLALDQRR